MIVLSRTQGQSIQISDDIELSVVCIRGQRAVIGICAAPTISIHRLDGNSTKFDYTDRRTNRKLPSS